MAWKTLIDCTPGERFCDPILYYSITEELKSFSDQIYSFLAGISSGYFMLVFIVFMSFFMVYVIMYIRVYLAGMFA